MHGFFALTDQDWYQFLLERSRQGSLDEVNFWAPSGKGAMSLPQGSPFFFQLKKPHYAIGGFGFLGPVSSLPLSFAWHAFGEGNGAASSEEMRIRVDKYRRRSSGKGGRTELDPVIGCRTILEPVFFAPEEWVAIASDWSKNIVVGKTYDLSEGEGARIWGECQARLRTLNRNLPEIGTVADSDGSRYGSEQSYRPRLGQGTFRVAILDAYGRSCAVTTEHSLPVLEAAHIRPYGKGGEHAVSNGLLLRSDLHRLYDGGYVTVTPNHQFQVSPLLRETWANGKIYYDLDGTTIQLPKSPDHQPDRELLDWHSNEVYQG
ncbi:MAG TPA: HNH endonuclease [Planctomycetes bacterium]|nr:HNH endonuclease [Planctomycetota bacterium]